MLANSKSYLFASSPHPIFLISDHFNFTSKKAAFCGHVGTVCGLGSDLKIAARDHGL
jgi:hypothetical protein